MSMLPKLVQYSILSSLFIYGIDEGGDSYKRMYLVFTIIKVLLFSQTSWTGFHSHSYSLIWDF